MSYKGTQLTQRRAGAVHLQAADFLRLQLRRPERAQHDLQQMGQRGLSKLRRLKTL